MSTLSLDRAISVWNDLEIQLERANLLIRAIRSINHFIPEVTANKLKRELAYAIMIAANFKGMAYYNSKVSINQFDWLIVASKIGDIQDKLNGCIKKLN